MKNKLKNFNIKKGYSNIDWEDKKDEKQNYKDTNIKKRIFQYLLGREKDGKPFYKDSETKEIKETNLELEEVKMKNQFIKIQKVRK